MDDRRVVAVVLAGGDALDPVAASAGVRSKALVPLPGGEPMGAYVATALRGSGVVDAIVWVGSSDERIGKSVDHTLPAGQRMVDSFTLGLGAALARASADHRILVVTADVPWWDAAGVRSFVREAPEAGLVYPVVRDRDALARFPDQKRTFVRLADGRFTGGNAVLVAPTCVAPLLPLLDAVFAARKRPLALAGIVGFGTLAALVAGKARLAAIEARVATLLGQSVRAFVSPDAAIAADLDDPAHLRHPLALPPLAP